MSSPISVYSTDDFPRRQRVRCWNEWSSATISPSRIEPVDQDNFRGSLRILDVSAFRFANFISAAASLAHTHEHVAAHDNPALILHVQLHGESLNVQDGRETVIREGDYCLCDSARPYSLYFDSLNDMLSLRIPHKYLRQRIPVPEDLTCIHMPGASGLSGIVSQLIRSCWSQYLSGGDPLLGTRLTENILDLLATSYAEVYAGVIDASSVMKTRRLLIRRFIEDHLHDPDLSVQSLAAAFRCTPAYVHKLFKAEDETVGRYILRRRLECAARLVRDPMHRGVQLSAIAFRVGFKNSTHFGRAFKERFGMTPGELRRHPNKMP
jgi:AraC family transcriptional regulator, positive regulator of tynA and feaB